MPEYHRGKARSPYRKRSANTATNHISVGSTGDLLLVNIPTGLIESKSWRGHVRYTDPGERSASGSYATGFVGFYRGEDTLAQVVGLSSQDLTGRSEFFGAQPWTVGYNDEIVELALVGITLSRGENLYLISHCSYENGFSGSRVLKGIGSFLYAVKEIPA